RGHAESRDQPRWIFQSDGRRLRESPDHQRDDCLLHELLDSGDVRSGRQRRICEEAQWSKRMQLTRETIRRVIETAAAIGIWVIGIAAMTAADNSPTVESLTATVKSLEEVRADLQLQLKVERARRI